MKNLKRVLSLGLASVMLLGMMVVGASAKDFTDAADIEHSEAVEIMVALGIIKGKEDGSTFAPKDNVTRGEMAKMIAVAMNGGNEEATGVKTVPTFTDIGTHWAQPWIEYCADMKIINGRGDGTFDPDGLVTGTEAAKMVLTALGYESEAYGLTGVSWATQAKEMAKTTDGKKLTTGLENVVMDAPATRDTAAQMIWNGLQAYVVTISPDQNKNNGEITWSYNTKTGITLLKQRYDANVVTGTYVGNDKYGTIAAEGEISVEYKYTDEGKSKTGTYYFPSDMSIDNIGEEVKVVWRDNVRGTAGAPDKHDTIFGVFNTGATRVERSTLGKLKDQKTGKAQINVDGVVCDVDDNVEIITNYATSTDTDTLGISVKGTAATAGKNADNSQLTYYLRGKTDKVTTPLKGTSGDAIKVCFNDDGKVDRIYITESVISVVTAVNSTAVVLNNGVGRVVLDENDVEDGLKKGDIVVATALYDSDNRFVTVKKAEKVSGEVEGFDGNKSITLSGKKYSTYNEGKVNSGKLLIADLNNLEGNDKAIADMNDGTDYVGKDFDLYMVNGYVGVAIQTSAANNNYSLILEVKDGGKKDSVFSGIQLYVMAADGTKEIINVSNDSKDENGKDIKNGSFSVGDIITYSFDDDDNAEVKIEAKAKASQSGEYKDSVKTLNGTVTTADCVLFVKTSNETMNSTNIASLVEGAEYAAYNIRDLDSVKMDSGYLTVVTKDKKVVAVFMDYQGEPDGASDDSVYAVISNVGNKVADGYIVYTAQSNGEEYTLRSKQNLQKGNLVKFRPTADNKYGSNKIVRYADAAKVTIPAGSKTLKAATAAWVDEYSVGDNSISFWTTAPDPVKNDKKETIGFSYGEKEPDATYALAKDVVIIYVDANGSKSEAEGSVDHFSELDGKANLFYTTKADGDETVIDVMFVETSAKTAINDKADKYTESSDKLE